jgi:hypothetical protein
VCGKIFWLWLLLAKSQPSSAVTYHRDVAPILERHCVQCHQVGEVGPFPLDSFEAVKKHARQVALAASTRFMPPWKPVAPGVAFHRDRRLSAAEIATLEAWVKQGALAGVAAAAKPKVVVPKPEPDQVWKMKSGYELSADGDDQYRCFAVPTGNDAVRFVEGFEFLPGNRRVVHHALLFFDLSGTGRKLDAGSGYPCFGSPGFLPSSSLGGWSPGNGRLQMPPGTAVRVPPGADIVFQIHYHPTGKPETDQSGVAVYFAKEPPKRFGKSSHMLILWREGYRPG